MPNDKVSIIIPCFNDYEHLITTLEKAKNQQYDHKEIILVDDGSNAMTKEVIQDNLSKIDILVTQENMGVSIARNNGIRKASGNLILTWDADDYFEKDFITKAVKEFQDKETVIVSCFSKWFSDNSREEKIFKPRGGDLKDVLFHNVAMGSAMFRKIKWENVGGYDEKMYLGFEDWEFYIRLLQGGGKAEIIPEVLFNYRNKLNSRNDKANLDKFKLQEYIYIKHAELYKNNYSLLIEHFLNELMKKDKYKNQIVNSADYIIGRAILKPFRVLGFK